MEMRVSFPGGKRVDAEFNGKVVHTDQPVENGGDGSAPSPFEYFLASLATCAGIYALSFCQERKIATEGMELHQSAEFAEEEGKRRLTRVSIRITLPPGFPEKYRNAIAKAAELCAVKKAVLLPPAFQVVAEFPSHDPRD